MPSQCLALGNLGHTAGIEREREGEGGGEGGREGGSEGGRERERERERVPHCEDCAVSNRR